MASRDNSTIGPDCPHVEHVWTQMPFAIVSALVAMAVGNVMCNMYGQPWYYAIAAGTVVIALIIPDRREPALAEFRSGRLVNSVPTKV